MSNKNELLELTVQAAKEIASTGPGTYVFAAPTEAAVTARQRTRLANAVKKTEWTYNTKVDTEAGTLTVVITEPSGELVVKKRRGRRKIESASELPRTRKVKEHVRVGTDGEAVLIQEHERSNGPDYTAAVLVGPTGVIESDPEVLVVHTVDGLYSDDVETVQRIFAAARLIPTATGKAITSAAYQRIGELLGIG